MSQVRSGLSNGVQCADKLIERNEAWRVLLV